MAVKFTNNAKTTLASGINSSVTTATVTDGSVFPTLDAGEHFYCTFDDGTNNEIVKVTARSGNTLTIIRGVDNTTARSFSSGDAAELRATSALLTDIQENIAAKSANQTVFSTTTASSATDYDIGIDPGVEANASVFLDGVYQHHNTFSFSGSTLTFDTAPVDGTALEVIVDNLVNLQSSNLTVDTFTAADVGGNPQTDFTLSDAPAAEDNLLVFIDGVFQDQDAYTISNQTLTITDGVTADFGVTVYVINPVNIGTPSDNTVTSSKLSGNITMPADLTVTGDVAFDSPTFVVDNANSRVGIGTASPSTLLDIVGDVNMSANLTVDTDTLHVDATNNHVGVGTSSPASTLDVRGVTNIRADGGNEQFVIKRDSSPNEQLLFGVHSSDYSYIQAIEQNVAYRPLSLNPSGGDVGINTTSPQAHFHVLGDASASVPAAGSGSSGGSIFSADLNTYGMFVGSITNGNGYIQQQRTDTATYYNLLLQPNGGKVGIATTSPYHTFDVFGDVIANGAAKSNGLFFDTTSATTGTGGGIALGGYSNGTGGEVYHFGNIQGIKENSTAGNYASAMLFSTRANGATPTERMRIDSSGNVGIGTTSPVARLTVDGATTGFAASGITLKRTGSLTGSSDIILAGNSGSEALSFRVNQSEKLRIDSSGNVGIGTTSPVKNLEIFGSGSESGILVKNDTNTNYRGYYIGSVESDNTAYAKFHMETNSGELNITSGYSGWGGFITFDTNGSERMRIDSSGNLLVGTTSSGAAEGLRVARNPSNAAVGVARFDSTLANDESYTAASFVKTSATTTTSQIFIKFGVAGYNSGCGQINANGSGQAAFGTHSDRRLKENILDLPSQLENIKALRPVEFDYIESEGGGHQLGFIAQEVEEVYPDAVGERHDGMKVLSGLGKWEARLIKAIQEQQAQIETLKQEIREIREGG